MPYPNFFHQNIKNKNYKFDRVSISVMALCIYAHFESKLRGVNDSLCLLLGGGRFGAGGHESSSGAGILDPSVFGVVEDVEISLTELLPSESRAACTCDLLEELIVN